MIRFLTLELELLSDVIQTAETSSLGVHHCLEYLKGSSILGAAAAVTYDALGSHAYTAFHSGRVRFLDAVLLAGDGTPMVPVPLGWLYPKGSPFEIDGVLVAETLYAVNHLGPDEAGRLGLRQMRGGYFSPAGLWASVERRYRLKTAIDRTVGGRPDEGRLFGSESLPAGSRWQTRIELDEDVGKEIAETLASAFDDRLVWLGRSRAAEYGRAHVRIVERGERTLGTPPPAAVHPVPEATVCLESDAALSDPETGEPTFTALPEHFGLPAGWRLDPWRSAVMTRRYSPFNRKRRRRESERLVLVRGSVLTFAGEEGADLDAARLHVQCGIGAWRQEGLGQARVAPDYLAGRHPDFVALPEPAPGATGEPMKPAEPPGPLASWMLRRCQASRRSELAFDEGRKAAERLIAVVRRLRAKKKPTPGRSQWNKLANLVRRHLDRTEPSVDEAREEVKRALLSGVGANAWQSEEPDGRPLLEQTIAAGLGAEDRDAAERLWQLCHTAQLMVRRLSQEADRSQSEEERRR